MRGGVRALAYTAAWLSPRPLHCWRRAPQVAHLMQADTDDISDLPVTEVRPGDRLLVRPSPTIAGAATQEVVDLITILNALRARAERRGGRIVGAPPMSATPTERPSSVVRSR
jgi:hypothetical protein